ncbi:unnamed protein product [Eruca vesicaria subsp. sativa]|uniref:ARM repeat superfamily protein n=1 Tax=Eruca vesicaria subsp. sativa TaxID=29727 RepID=A0ABC8ITW1_ERUVS|nr:unnamed protein product [Eruca vesicaria subsp. sativa]
MDCPSHHPPPPPDELFDIDTTVDPTFIISLIRKLLPVDSGSGQRTQIKHNPSYGCQQCGSRILTTGLYGAGSTLWAECLQSDDILRRVLWIAENTLNPHLIEKSVGLLLGILEGESEVGKLLIPPLMTLGLTSLLINLLSFEMSKLVKERIPERYSVLEMILRAIEALSASDSRSKDICSSKELFHLVCDLMKLQDKAEVATCCVTAGVLIANILSETVSFIPEISQDFSFLEGLFSTLPFASDDLEARRALWSVIARLFARVNESEIDTFSLRQYILVLLSNSDIIEDDLLIMQLEDSFPSHSSRTIAIQKIESMLNNWNIRKETLQEDNMDGDGSLNTSDVRRLYDCCQRYISK